MADKINVELDNQFLEKFFSLTDRILPEGQEVTSLMLKNQLDELEEVLEQSKVDKKELEDLKSKFQKAHFQQGGAIEDSFGDMPSGSSGDDLGDAPEGGLNLSKKSILVVDDLGVITYQLSVLLKKAGYETSESREIYDAIEKFKKQKFDLVIMDLFIPTEREGFILLEELRKIAVNKKQKVKIGVMSASGKKEHKQLCKMKGSEFYIEKIDNWQKELLGLVRTLLAKVV
jgi:CheY-like chemotaxis protein